jgi:hypothetical protein
MSRLLPVAPHRQPHPVSAARLARLILLPALSLFCLLTGCISKEKIPFSDDAQMAREQAAVEAADEPKLQKLSPTDEWQVETIVYGALLERDFWNANQYTAVFLQGADDEVARLQRKFPDHNPPIKASDHATLAPHQPPIDKDTGRPAMILSVETGAPIGDTVVAVGKWYAGDAMTGSSEFVLKKTGDNWEIQNTK